MSGISVRVEGAKELERMLAGWKPSARRRIVRPGVRKAASIVSKAAKARAPVGSGLLKKSIGVKMRTYRDGTVVGVVGPRHGFKRAVSGSGRSRTIVTKKNVSEFHNSLVRVRAQNPVKYAHLVHGGTQPHAIGKGSQIVRSRVEGSAVAVSKSGARYRRTIRSTSAGTQTGRMHPGTRANPFLRDAFTTTRAAQQRAIREAVGKGVTKEAQRLLRRRGYVA